MGLRENYTSAPPLGCFQALDNLARDGRPWPITGPFQSESVPIGCFGEKFCLPPDIPLDVFHFFTKKTGEIFS